MSIEYLVHHGIKGQKHGFRRWQNEDGSLTLEGRVHYGIGEVKKAAGVVKEGFRSGYFKQKAEWKAQDAKKAATSAYRSPAGRRVSELKREASYKAGYAFIDACGLISDASMRFVRK